jgi:hypothetical protein
MEDKDRHEREYIKYLIENKKSIDTSLLDSYFTDEIGFDELIEGVELGEVLSFRTFIKSKKIDDILGNDKDNR